MTVDDNTGTPTGPSDDDAKSVEPTASEPTEPIEPTASEPVEPAVVEPVEPAMVEPTEPTASEPVQPTAVEPIEPTASEPVVEPVFTEPTAEEFEADQSEEPELEDSTPELVAAGGAVAARTRDTAPSKAKPAGAADAQPSGGIFARLKARIQRIATFYRQVAAELRKVIWPTRKELITYTSVVLVFVFIMVTIVGIFDFAFGQAVIKVFGS